MLAHKFSAEQCLWAGICSQTEWAWSWLKVLSVGIILHSTRGYSRSAAAKALSANLLVVVSIVKDCVIAVLDWHGS